MCYVKLYGMFYNQVVKDFYLVQVIVKVVYDYDLLLILVGLVGSELIWVGECYCLVMWQEVFVDCGYQVDGSLVLCM